MIFKMRCLVFGDSLFEGVNVKKTIAEYMSEINPNYTIDNMAVSGTTIGEYSIYPVDGSSLLSTYELEGINPKHIDYIFLCYGSNDISAFMCGFITVRQVIVNFVKAVDGLRQYYPNAKIVFLSVTSYGEILRKYAELQCNYLENDYFKGYNFTFPVSVYVDNYATLHDQIVASQEKTGIKVIPMIQNPHFFDKCIGPDNLHPNDLGNKLIAETIMREL